MEILRVISVCFSPIFLWAVPYSDAHSDEIASICTPNVIGEKIIASALVRRQAGSLIKPALSDRVNGFAWPDTPMGVVRLGAGYGFFASNGALHSGPGENGKSGSVVRSVGTLDNPLGTNPPIDRVISPNPDRSINPEYGGYSYFGGGPVLRVPEGFPGAGKLLMVTHAELSTPDTKPTLSFYSILGLTRSNDDGDSWTALGEIIRPNHPYAADMDGFEIGDPPLVMTPDHKFIMIYFRDWMGNAKHWGSDLTHLSVARASTDAVFSAAFGKDLYRAAKFQKYFNGSWDEPGIGGRSSDLAPAFVSASELQVSYNSFTQRFVMIASAGDGLYYSESSEGLLWTRSRRFFDFGRRKITTYVMPVGIGMDPSSLEKTFDIIYSAYPTDGGGWGGAEVRSLRVSCQ